jgi:hypothetical protein
VASRRLALSFQVSDDLRDMKQRIIHNDSSPWLTKIVRCLLLWFLCQSVLVVANPLAAVGEYCTTTDDSNAASHQMAKASGHALATTAITLPDHDDHSTCGHCIFVCQLMASSSDSLPRFSGQSLQIDSRLLFPTTPPLDLPLRPPITV